MFRLHSIAIVDADDYKQSPLSNFTFSYLPWGAMAKPILAEDGDGWVEIIHNPSHYRRSGKYLIQNTTNA